MRVAYLTLDEVNQHLASGFADEHGVNLEVHACPQAIGEREYDAVIYDPGSFSPHERDANLRAVLVCPMDKPLAVHGYDFAPDQLQVLRKRGAIVVRRLGTGVFARLVNAVRAAGRQQTVA